MRKKFIKELFSPEDPYNWESDKFAQVGDELLKESEKLGVFKKPSGKPPPPKEIDEGE